MIEAVNVGDKITVDNGLINLEVLKKEERLMQCRVLDGGVLRSKSHVNLPGIRVNILKEREGFQSADKVVVISDVLAQQRIDSIQIRLIP